MSKPYFIFIALSIIITLAISTQAQIHLSGSLSGVLEPGEYIVDDHIQVDSTDTLIIEPGANLRFDGHYKFSIYGLLQAIGTEQDSILFTRLNPTEESKWWGIRFYESASDSSILQNCVIEWGRATGLSNNGGGIYANGVYLTISNCAILNNCAYDRGGGIYNTNCASPTVTNCLIKDNYASNGGGGIYYTNCASPTVTNCLIENNLASDDGGGLFSMSSDISILDCIIQNNSVEGNLTKGGGMYLSYSSPRIEGCEVLDNSATGQGIGIYAYLCSLIVISDCSIQENTSINNTSGLYLWLSTFSIENTTIELNHGMGVWLSYSEGNMDSCSIINNISNGIYCREDSELNLIDCNIQGNLANGVLLSNSEAFVSHCLISDNLGSGISSVSSSGYFLNNTISHNAGNGFYLNSSNLEIKNSIIEGNIAGAGIYFLSSMATAVSYSDFHANSQGAFAGNYPTGLGVLTNINANGDSCDVFYNILLDPLFHSTTGDSAFYLTSDSPCIDTGDPNSPPDPDGSVADMGAFYFDQSSTGVHVEGYCYLQNQTNHQGTKVLFQAVSPGAVTDSTFTDSSGYYHSYLEPGIYDIFYSHFGYETNELLNQNCSSPVTFPEITLIQSTPIYNISGQLSGILETAIYIVEGNIFVNPGDSLYIEHGSVFLFNGDYEFNINGYLHAAGTEEDSIKFMPEDWVVNWGGINFNQPASDSCRMEYCYITGSDGQGIYIASGSPVIQNTTITDNSSDSSGAGLYCGEGSSPVILNCLISNNSTIDSDGGAIYCAENCTGFFSECEIDSNYGGGIHIETSAPIFEDCNIHSNIKLGPSYGGGISSLSGSPVFFHCDINNNIADYGGGGIRCVYDGYPSFIDCNIIGNSTLAGISSGGGIYIRWWAVAYFEGCTISGNAAVDGGGGVYIYASCPTFNDCVIEDNIASYGGGIALDANATADLVGCIVADNSTDNLRSYNAYISLSNCTINGSSGNNIYYGNGSTLSATNTIISFANGGAGIEFVSSFIPNIDYCDFFGNSSGAFIGNVPPLIGELIMVNANGDSCDIYNNIFLRPLFVDPSNGNYHLTENSPCIDAGDPDFPPDPDFTIPDIGAYYFDQNITPNLFVELIPYSTPIYIPSGGGSFNYDITIENIDTMEVYFHGWIDVIFPDSSALSPKAIRMNLFLSPGETISWDSLTQFIPSRAPAGNYSYIGHVGIYPDNIVCMDSFNFEKLPGLDAPAHDLGWSLLGWEDGEIPLTPESPTEITLLPPYPNPFNPSTTISFDLPEPQKVSLVLYNVLGREVARLVNEWLPAGNHQRIWKAEGLPSGIYFVCLTVGDFRQTRKILLIK